ncbi:PREDICTED: cathepsin G isoform X2 [Capra hircus]|uniref:cathepsin G isoform X2 n=1 Tax=Capra hircus TaxID=9925 RepID=UPI0008474DBC|nr:PREDICTED: cathepsin G isoform X2 [Capra hircus]
MRPLLLLMAFLLSPRARAGQIIGGREARPHSRPYMAYIQTLTPAGLTICGGFLVREDFVMTAARCLGSQINVILGIHSVTASEWTQQRIPVLRPIPHPRYDQRNNRNDIMLLQGDSGGPLVCSNVAQGIVSYGDRVGTPPAVFTRISSFLPWIRRTMRRFQEWTPE